MKQLRAILDRLRLGRRPPTGPLTTAEQATADARETSTSDGQATSDDDDPSETG